MLFREIITVYIETHVKHINTLWAKCKSYLMLKLVVNVVTTIPSRVKIDKLRRGKVKCAVWCVEQVKFVLLQGQRRDGTKDVGGVTEAATTIPVWGDPCTRHLEAATALQQWPRFTQYSCSGGCQWGEWTGPWYTLFWAVTPLNTWISGEVHQA
jgi:hypothetical protein